jgi:hypothetical protein
VLLADLDQRLRAAEVHVLGHLSDEDATAFRVLLQRVATHANALDPAGQRTRDRAGDQRHCRSVRSGTAAVMLRSPSLALTVFWSLSVCGYRTSGT